MNGGNELRHRRQYLALRVNESSPKHARARAFLNECVVSSEIMYVPWMTVSAYLRVSTHPRIFDQPLDPARALGNVAALLALPHVRVLSEVDGFWSHFREVAEAFPVRGNLVPDARLAALLRQHGIRVLYTNDADFKKLDALDARNPFDDPVHLGRQST
jgi:uncharacterized protein